MKENKHPKITFQGHYRSQSGKPASDSISFAFSRVIILFFYFFTGAFSGSLLNAQVKVWTLDECIKYALEQNIQVLKAGVGNDISTADLLQSKSVRYPSFSGSARQNLDWSNQLNTSGSTVFKGSNGTNISLSSSVDLFNDFKLQNGVKKSETDLEASKYNVEVIKETLSLNVLNAYLQVLYAEEQVKNSVNQVASTEEQLKLAEERMKMGVISTSDYLLVKSQLANENLTLATARSQLAINRVTLMQYMELPVTEDFDIASPNIDSLITKKRYPSSKDVYNSALQFKPEVKYAELNKESSELDIDIARADYFPRVSMDAGISTLYSGNNSASSFGYQFSKNISPSIGLSVAIPIYSNRQVRTRVDVAKMNMNNSELDELNTKNQLRKEIEQACLDVTSSQIEYDASAQQYQAAKESFDVASEKFVKGILSSVDLLVQRTNFISAESAFLQSKYKLVFSYKILDFYLGVPISL